MLFQPHSTESSIVSKNAGGIVPLNVYELSKIDVLVIFEPTVLDK